MIYRPFDYSGDFSEYSLNTAEIKESIKTEEKRLVEINISYPMPKENCFEKTAEEKIGTYYKKIAENFANFGRGKLKKMAEETLKEGDSPFSAVMKFIPTFENDALISIVLDVFVYYNARKSQTKRYSNIFLKTKFGLLTCSDFFSKGARSKITEYISKEYATQGKTTTDIETNDNPEREIKRNFDENNFFLTSNGYGFYFNAGTLSNGNLPSVYIIPYDSFPEVEVGRRLYIL